MLSTNDTDRWLILFRCNIINPFLEQLAKIFKIQIAKKKCLPIPLSTVEVYRTYVCT